ncbi:hypothetical protein DV737_g133, partial [Chaetothyriales sp. CBS 132003]
MASETGASLAQAIEGSTADYAEVEAAFEELVRRVNIPINSTTPPALQQAIQHDPFSSAGKYGILFVVMLIALLVLATLMRMYHFWGDRIRTALHKEEVLNSAREWSPSLIRTDDVELPSAITDTSSTRHFFPSKGPLLPEKAKQQASVSALAPINNTIALFRWVFYRPVPQLRLGPWRFGFPSLGVIAIVVVALAASMLYCFLPTPMFYASMSYGSPPLAIRAGMISVSLLPWIVATSSKANLVSYMTGIGHERLIVLHRWMAYIFAIFAVIHAVPFWWQSVHDPDGFRTWKLYFANQPWYIYTTGIAAMAPLIFLTVHSLPILRNRFYEIFAMLHAPVAYGFVGLMFWHCNKALTSWSYLWATVTLILTSMILRVFYLNWMNPLWASWLIGEESAVTILPDKAVKVTIPTRKRWKPGQYVYLRMPGVSLMENHPFTIASLCSDDFPSEYGDEYRDMILVFRPFGGFTRKLYDISLQKGPYKTYRAFIDGPYGGMQRQMSSFDQVIFFAGGSGITAIASQLLDLIKRMRDGKATTTRVHVIWAMKRPELMEWFREELRICRECAPPGSMQCHFFITAAKRYEHLLTGDMRENRLSGLRDRINGALQGVASKRSSTLMGNGEHEMKREAEDVITALPQAYLSPPRQSKRNSTLSQAQSDAVRKFDFGFPQTPTQFQKNLMRFAFLPTQARRDGWRTEYGRPDIAYMLKGLSGEFGRRTCIYVCGPPSMRTEVARTTAALQHDVFTDPNKDEIYLHAENYAL